MKRKLALGLVAFAGGLTIIGSGFASWYFGNTDISKSASIGYHTTDLNDGIGELTLTYTLNTASAATDLGEDDKLYLCLDQGQYSNLNDNAYGISFHKFTTAPTKDSDFTADTLLSKLGVKYTISEENLTTLQNAGVTKGTLTTTFTLNSAYLDFTDTGATTTLTKTETIDLKDVSATDAVYTTSFDYDVSTTDFGTKAKNAMLQYKTKPTSTETYNSMKSELATHDSVLDIKTTFNVAVAA